MNFLQSIFKKDHSAERDREISEVVPISECSHECESCTTKYPSSVKIDTSEDIYNSAKQTACHFIVPTGQSDWQHDATSTPHSIENNIVQWIEKESSGLFDHGSVKCSTSSLPIDFMDPKAMERQRGDVLIMPFFVWVRRVDAENVGAVLSELIPQLIKARNEQAQPPAEVQGYAVDNTEARAYIFLCSHKTRDKRCAITAPLMKKEMDARLRETGNYRDIGDDSEDGVHVSFINHVGGHKYAANVIIYLRTGEILWLARCTPATAKPIIDETVLGGGKVWGDLVRVVQKEKAIEW